MEVAPLAMSVSYAHIGVVVLEAHTFVRGDQADLNQGMQKVELRQMGNEPMHDEGHVGPYRQLRMAAVLGQIVECVAWASSAFPIGTGRSGGMSRTQSPCKKLVSGQVQVSFQTLPSVAGHVKSGQLKALAVTSPTRSALFPDVPTAAEAGLKNLEVSAWYSIVVPAGTPRPIIDRLNEAFNKALKQKDVITKLQPEGAVIVGSTPGQAADFMRAESKKWGNVVKLTGMRVD